MSSADITFGGRCDLPSRHSNQALCYPDIGYPDIGYPDISYPDISYPDISYKEPAMSLQGTKTHENLMDAFAGESQANRRYTWFAQKADIEGFPDAAMLFRSVAEGETGHALGHLEYLALVGDPATGEPIGETSDNFKASIAGETYEYTQMYPGFAKTARDEGFSEIADWFETLARAEKSHAGRFQKGLDSLA